MNDSVFREYLGLKRLKLTRERIAVLNEAFAFPGHFEPEQLYQRIKDLGIKASRASVYRTLTLLVESGLIEKVTRTEKGTVYEQAYGKKHHDHMICSRCGRFIEFFSQDLEQLQEAICSRNGFNGISHTLEIRGVCESCSAK
ncbi:MAG: transcriptional repressor [Thermodesulfovibrionales bacterium]